MARNRAAWTAAFALVALSGASAWADTVQLDQRLDTGTGAVVVIKDEQVWYEFAQSFTVGLTGRFDHVDLDLWAPLLLDATGAVQSYGAGDLVVDVRTTSSGTPTTANSGSEILGSATIAGSSLPHSNHGFVSIDFSSFNFTVTSGQVLAIGLRDALWNGIGDSAHTDAYGSTGSSGYALGQAWYMDQNLSTRCWTGLASDLNFRTYVSTPVLVTLREAPVPTAAWMGFDLLTAMAGIGAVRRRRRLAVL